MLGRRLAHLVRHGSKRLDDPVRARIVGDRTVALNVSGMIRRPCPGSVSTTRTPFARSYCDRTAAPHPSFGVRSSCPPQRPDHRARHTGRVKRYAVWASWATLASYAVALWLMSQGPSHLGDLGIYLWLLAMVFALLTVGVAGLAIAADRGAAVGALVFAISVFVLGVGLSVLLIASIPYQN